MTEQDAQQRLASPPSPNVMGRDCMRIIERHWVTPEPPSNIPPFEVVNTHEWEIF